MTLEHVRRFGYIAPFANVLSIRRHGIVSHNAAARLRTGDISDPAVQARRAVVTVPGGFALHSYANVYLNPRNAMLFKLRFEAVAVLAIRREMLVERTDALVTDANAACVGTRFYPSVRGLDFLDEAEVFCSNWRLTDPVASDRAKRRAMAEALFPEAVSPENILGAFVADERRRMELMSIVGDPLFPVKVDADLFFGGSS